jgi:hypothetical protein
VKARSTCIAILVLLVGCGTIEEKVQPVTLSGSDPREICVIENSDVRHEFLEAYSSALSSKGLTVRMLPAGASVGSCPLTSTYTANWRWDLALYLAYANLKVYRSSRLVGEAMYNSLDAAGNTDKFINARLKVQKLADQLFPG